MKRKLLFSLLLVFLILITFYSPIDMHAKKLLDEALLRSFSAFGLAKALNAAISML